MLKSVKVFFVFVSLVSSLAGCSSREGLSGRGYRSDELLMTVPSDAAVVGVYSRCSDLLDVALDSTDILKKCVPARLRHSKAVLSWTYNGTLVPLLSISAPSDTSSAVRALCDSAVSMGLFARYLDSGTAPLGKGVVLVSRSENLLESSLRHISSNHSIFDAKGFCDAVRHVDSGADFLVWNNGAAGKWLRKDCLSIMYQRRDVVGFMKNLSEWTVVCPSRPKAPYEATVTLFRNGEGDCYADFLESLDPSKSKACEILPSASEFVLDLLVRNPKEFRESFRRHLDCRAKLTAYQTECSAMKEKYGMDPEKWALEYSFREVAIVRWGGHGVILLRPTKKPAATEIVENRLPGYPALVYGKAFSLEDDSCFGVFGKWIVLGSEEDVSAFISLPSDERGMDLPDNKSRFLVYDLKDGTVNLIHEKGGSVMLNVY